MGTLTPQKINFKSKTPKRQRILQNDKISNPPKEITVITVYACCIRSPKYMMQTLTELKGQTKIQ